MSGSCPGEPLTALVDGALSHDERDRVHAHLAGCDTCRAEVEALRRVKARLAGLARSTPPPPPGLLSSLRALAVPGVEPATRPVPDVRRAPLERGGHAAVGARTRPPSSAPAGRPRSLRTRRLRRGGLVGGGLLAVGAGLVLLGGPATTPASTPVDPGSDAFVVDFVSTTNSMPLGDPAGGAAMLPRP